MPSTTCGVSHQALPARTTAGTTGTVTVCNMVTGDQQQAPTSAEPSMVTASLNSRVQSPVQEGLTEWDRAWFGSHHRTQGRMVTERNVAQSRTVPTGDM